MKRFKNILVAADTRQESHPIVAEAAEIARRNQAALKIVDIVPEFSWVARLTVKDHDHVRDLLIQEKQEKLEALAAALRETGLKVETKPLVGQASVEIVREVLRSGHDLVLSVSKGRDSRREGAFGTTATRLLRQCPCPLWLVTAGAMPRFSHVLACVNTSSPEPADAELNDKIYELAHSISQYHGGRFSIAHAWTIWNEPMIAHRMSPEEFAAVEARYESHAASHLEALLQRHGVTRDEGVHLLKGEASDVIPRFVRESQVDLIVMGTVARAGLSGMVMGNTAEMILSRIACSVLALKPAGFVSPVKLT